MNQFISSSNTNYYLFTVFVITFVCLNQHQTSANRLPSKPDYQQNSLAYNDLSYEDLGDNEYPMITNTNNIYPIDYEESVYSNPWSQFFHQRYQPSMILPYYSPSLKSGLALRRGRPRYASFPYPKRSIPIELQKALFAHGIVGRRR
ncbi:unnamed protein product [Adineta ricciae]|uniref:Uncharacterized protein n=1 Tax=Adineta ricciae TaxID=249248 RepID=A0A813WPH7_ADIRI|nr:unnamed protein product [Adineta ricciae]CAF0864330.1 unnamed protein product [Adineta ricciae]